MQCVEIELDPQEAVIAEPGSFMMMTDGIQMQTLFGDGNEKGIMGKLFSAGNRLLTGEDLFMTVYTNTSQQKRQVSFAAPYAGKIIPLDLHRLNGKIICQKDSFLCAAKGVSVGIEFQKTGKEGHVNCFLSSAPPGRRSRDSHRIASIRGQNQIWEGFRHVREVDGWTGR